jgi:hypothetical protein
VNLCNTGLPHCSARQQNVNSHNCTEKGQNPKKRITDQHSIRQNSNCFHIQEVILVIKSTSENKSKEDNRSQFEENPEKSVQASLVASSASEKNREQEVEG